jgi:BirA family biotin operon repressor/biotin-[acetyl-CoA-carboxylase] ligase
LRDHGLAEASLKWPNDVVLGEKKLAGILCEFVPSGWVIVGVGLNIDFPVGAPPSPRAAGLFHHLSAAEGLVDSVLAGFVTELRDWVDDVRTRVSHDNVARVSSVMGTLDRPVEVHEPSGTQWRGVAHCLDQAGHLLVMPEGLSELRAVVASDIEHLYQ